MLGVPGAVLTISLESFLKSVELFFGKDGHGGVFIHKKPVPLICLYSVPASLVSDRLSSVSVKFTYERWVAQDVHHRRSVHLHTMLFPHSLAALV